MKPIAVVGASGFVGQAVSAALRRRGHEVFPVRAPRLVQVPSARTHNTEIEYLKEVAAVSDALINCAGLPDATGGSSQSLFGANAILPGVVGQVASDAGIRFVHVSSAAVQGRRRVLDATGETAPFSPYSESKVRGERAALSQPTTVVYRPPGVHSPQRQVTQSIAALARSPFASVAGDGNANSPQALVENVGDAIAYLATCTAQVPRIVSHPSEGLTTGGLLEDLGGKPPHRIPSSLAKAAVDMAFAGSKLRTGLSGAARRLEMVWFGQDQAESWLTNDGWTPPKDRAAWRAIGLTLAQDANRKDKT